MDGWRDRPQNGHPHGEIVGQTNALTDILTINFKFARFDTKQSKCVTIIRPLLALKIWPCFGLVNESLTIILSFLSFFG